MEALFTSIQGERPQATSANIEGTIPVWIEGSLYRNGPGKFEWGDDSYNHWFDGPALIHRFHISQGKVTYQNRFIRTDTFLQNQAANRIVVSEFGTMAHPDPCKSYYKRFFSYFQAPKTDNTLVSVFPIGDKLFTSSETNVLNEIDPTTLEKKDKLDLTSLVAVNYATAHPHVDTDGTYHNLGTIMKGGPRYAIIKLDPDTKGDDGEVVAGKAEVVATVPIQWKMHPSYFHSFAMSENYYVLVEQPLALNILKLFTSKMRGKTFHDAMEWHDGYPMKLHVIDKRTGQKVNPGFSYHAHASVFIHHINCYEENDTLVLDTCAFEAGNVFDDFDLKVLQTEKCFDVLSQVPKPKARRYVLPLGAINADDVGEKNLAPLDYTTASAQLKDKTTIHLGYEVLCETYLEFPVIDYRNRNTKKYRYFYGCGYEKTALDTIMKVDIETKQPLIWRSEGCFPSEPIFVAHPQQKAEDHGVVLSMVLTTGANRHAFMLVLDAKDLREIGRAVVDVQLPRDMHGIFMPNL